MPEVRSQRQWLFHYIALFIIALGAGIFFIQEPGFGDELTYWSLAFDLHQTGGSAWSVHSFHDLRWPIWGISWLWQSFFGPGLASFYCGPLFYLAAAATLAFTFGRLVLRTAAGAWSCAIALIFAPVLDAVIYRSMPDLSEGVFTASALLAWWTMMLANTPRRALVHGILSGICIGLAFSNRVTGLFITPVLAVGTVLFFPRRWKWLFVPALVAALFFAIEGAIYYHVCGDWLHSIHANLGGTRAKDVEAMPVWRLPLRYLGGFFRGNRIAPLYAISACGGLWTAWRRSATEGKLLVVWFGVIYLEYSCAIQSIHPVRPLIGSTFRYMAVFGLPMSVLAGVGAVELSRFLLGTQWARTRQLPLSRRPLLLGSSAILLLLLCTSRPFFDLGYTAELRRHMAALPDGTKIFSHHAMHNIACMVDATAARRFTWRAPDKILVRTEQLEGEATGCDEFWYLRKLLWLTERKRIERHQSSIQPVLGSYLESPEQNWILNDILEKGDGTDIVLYRKRPSHAAPAHTLTADAPELGGLLPKLPAIWNPKENQAAFVAKWNIPIELRGKLISLRIQGASTSVEPLIIKLDFATGLPRRENFSLRPILYPSGGNDFFAVEIPATAKACDVEVRFPKHAGPTQLTGLRVIYDDIR